MKVRLPAPVKHGPAVLAAGVHDLPVELAGLLLSRGWAVPYSPSLPLSVEPVQLVAHPPE